MVGLCINRYSFQFLHRSFMFFSEVINNPASDNPAEIGSESCNIRIKFEGLALLEKLQHDLLTNIISGSRIQAFEFGKSLDNRGILFVKIIPADNNYNFSPLLLQRLHNYIEINNSTFFQKIL